MGRIEEALAKLQARSELEKRSAPPRPLARVTDVPPGSGPQHHSYGGKYVEIDFAELRSQGLLAPDSEERRLADEYRVIKRPLIGNASSARSPRLQRGNLIMVASATPGEGKTFTCVNLSLSMALEKDWTIVLADGDCSKPHLTRLFGAQHEPGLLDLLRDASLSLEQVIMPTNVPGLGLLPAGRQDEQAAELLASARMDALCNEIATRDSQRIVIFDSSPLLYTTEAPVLASQVGQVVVVVHAGKTPQQMVLTAIGKLDHAKAINLILNQASEGDAVTYGGYYGYGYGHGYGTAAGEKAAG